MLEIVIESKNLRKTEDKLFLIFLRIVILSQCVFFDFAVDPFTIDSLSLLICAILASFIEECLLSLLRGHYVRFIYKLKLIEQ